MKNLLKIHNLIFFLLLIANSALAEPSAQGSEEVLAHKPITGHDQESKMQFMVYESVRNKGFETAKQFSKMTFYIAPFFRLIPNHRTGEPYDRLEIEEESIVSYAFTIECFADRIEQQALATINKFYEKSTDGKYPFSLSQIQPMSHGMVVITPSNLPKRLSKAIRPAVKPADENSPIHTTFLLGTTARFTILVPAEHDNVFKKILDKQGLDFTFRVYFNVMKLQVKQILWDAEDIRNTQAYRELMGKGERYFDAKQINKVVREAARKVGVFDYADPGVEGKLDSKARDVFNQLTEGTQKIGLATMADASALEERILQHSGLELTDYQPITLMWEVSRELEQARDYKEANEKVKDTYRRQKNALEKAQKNYRGKKKSLSVSGKAEVSLPIPLVNIKGSVSVNYSRSSDVAKSTQEAIDQLDDQTNKDLFKNNTELTQFKKNREQRHGKEVVIEGRGLNLIEKGHLEQNLSMLGDYLAVRPLSEARTFTTSSSTPLLGRTHCLAESENNRFQDLLKDNGVLGPKMVVIPAGDLVTKHNRFTFSKSFGISQYEITFTEYDYFCESTGSQKPEDAGWGRGDQPVINVTWEQANAYANWLSAQTGYRYRLPTESQWEYALRAGSDTHYFFGHQNLALCDYGNGADRLSRYSWKNVRCTDGYANKTAPVGVFKPNRWQVYDLIGNVWEWTCSAYDFESEQQISNQCDATLDSKNPEDINIVIRGGSWNSEPRYLQSSHRDWTSITNSNDTIGIRLVREITID